MKFLKKVGIFRKLYEAIHYKDKENGVDSFRPKTHEESIKSMEVEMELQKKRAMEIDARIIGIIEKINKINAS